MKVVGTTLPLPHVLAARFGLRTINIRVALHLAQEPHVFDERGEKLLAVRNVPPTVKGAVGLAELRGIRHILTPSTGDIVDFRAALSCLHPHVSQPLLPVYPGDEQRTREGVDAVLSRLSVGQGPVVEPVDVSVFSKVLGDLERRQLAGAFCSVDWQSFLLSLVQGTDARLPEEDGRQGQRARVAVLGYLAGMPDLMSYVEAFGGRVVYAEWPQMAARLALSGSPYQALANSPLVLGLGARLAHAQRAADQVDAYILVTEPFCSLALEEAWFRAHLRKPLLMLESESLGILDATRLSRLESFAGVAFGGHSRDRA